MRLHTTWLPDTRRGQLNAARLLLFCLVLPAALLLANCPHEDECSHGSDAKRRRCNLVRVVIPRLIQSESSAAADRFEPNDTAPQAYCVHGLNEGIYPGHLMTFPSSLDRDLFRVEVPTAGSTFTMSFPFGSTGLGWLFQVRILAADGTTVLRDVLLPGAETPMTGDISTGKFNIDHAFVSAGTHYVEFRALSDSDARLNVEFYGATDACPEE